MTAAVDRSSRVPAGPLQGRSANRPTVQTLCLQGHCPMKAAPPKPVDGRINQCCEIGALRHKSREAIPLLGHHRLDQVASSVIASIPSPGSTLSIQAQNRLTR